MNPPGRAHSSCAQQGPDVDAHPGSQPPGEKLCSSAASGFSTARAGPAAGRWGLLLLSRWEVPPAAPHTLFCQPFTSLQRLRTRRDSTHSAFRAGLGPSHSPGSRGGGGPVCSVTLSLSLESQLGDEKDNDHIDVTKPSRSRLPRARCSPALGPSSVPLLPAILPSGRECSRSTDEKTEPRGGNEEQRRRLGAAGWAVHVSQPPPCILTEPLWSTWIGLIFWTENKAWCVAATPPKPGHAGGRCCSAASALVPPATP